LRILEFSEKHLRDCLNKQQVGNSRKRDIKVLTGVFLNWCIKSKEITVTNFTKKIDIELAYKDVVILKPCEAINILALCESSYPEFTLYHAICLFAGLRPSECEKLTWENINLIERQITVRGETSKVKDTRNVHIEDNLFEWINGHQGLRKGLLTNPDAIREEGKVKGLRYRLECIHRDLGYRVKTKNTDAGFWPKDVMRHSYATYWLSKYNDRPHLAENMGNSPTIIRKHYKTIVSKSATEEFWNIKPSSSEIVPTVGMEAGRKGRARKLAKVKKRCPSPPAE